MEHYLSPEQELCASYTRRHQPGMNCDTSWRTFLQQADEASLEKVYFESFNTLYAYALKITGDHSRALDAIQEVFLNLWKYRKRLNVDAGAMPYLLKALRNESIRIVRQSEKYAPLTGEPRRIVFIPEEFSDESLDHIERQRVIECMNRLPPRQREILYLRFYENLCYEDIANVLGITYQSAINQAFRAVSKLRKMDALQKVYFCSV